jgi:hypothetical protein
MSFENDAKDGTTSPTVEQIVGDSEIYIDPIAEAKALRKCDMVLIPLFTIAFMSAYLDRSNIGNAQTAGLMTDLNMSTQQYASMSNTKHLVRKYAHILYRCRFIVLCVLCPIRIAGCHSCQEDSSKSTAPFLHARVESHLPRNRIHEDCASVLRFQTPYWLF